jgi:hypothetical protein
MTAGEKEGVVVEKASAAEGFPNKYYPRELAEREYKRVKLRRDFVRAVSNTGSTDSPLGTERVSPERRNDFVGLALSGGGIRSATFCLGVCQHFAESRILRRFDFLSTVSGGGFFGGFLGAWIHRDGIHDVEPKLEDSESPPVRFLRENGRYIAPNGSGDAGVALASYLRGWLAILLALGITLFAVFVAGAASEAWVLNKTTLVRDNFPSLLFTHFGSFWLSLYWLVPYFVCVLWVIPMGGAFWLLGEKPLRLTPIVKLFMVITGLVMVAYAVKRPEGWLRIEEADFMGIAGICFLSLAAYLWKESCGVENVPRSALISLLAFAAVFGAYVAFNGFNLIWIGAKDQFSAALVIKQGIIIAAPDAKLPVEGHWLLWTAFVILSYSWSVSYWGSAFTDNIDFIRRKLTELTAMGLWAMLAFAIFALVDTLGRTLAGKVLENGNWSAFKKVFTLGPTAALSLVASVKLFMRQAGSLADKANPKTRMAVLIGVCALALALACCTTLSLMAHLAVANCLSHDGDRLEALLIGLLILVFTIGRTTTLLNLSSDLQLYTARVTRAYLGASNPIRQQSLEKQNVTQPVRGDDIPFDGYHPEDKGGPLHIINATVNETIAGRSNLEQRDRHGFSMALGPEGISTGRVAHALFDARATPETDRKSGKQSFKSRFVQTTVAVRKLWSKEVCITPIQGPAFHPLAHDPKYPTRGMVEALTTGGWMGVSGAAFSTGLGQQTNRAYSFLAGFFNIRLGYWWNSRINPIQRIIVSKDLKLRRTVSLGLGDWLGTTMSEILSAPCYLIDELTARFHGPSARRLWNLSDGGHFENTATYELIRRRVSFIVMCDCGADNEYQFEDLANLVRKARIDLDAEITFLDRPELSSLLAPDLLPYFGHPISFARSASGTCPYCAALARIEYFNEGTPSGWLLVLKPALLGDEPLDVHDYASNNHTFPQESTLEQFFNEEQWESYRRLGRFIASRIFSMKSSTDNATGWRPISLSPSETL